MPLTVSKISFKMTELQNVFDPFLRGTNLCKIDGNLKSFNIII